MLDRSVFLRFAAQDCIDDQGRVEKRDTLARNRKIRDAAIVAGVIGLLSLAPSADASPGVGAARETSGTGEFSGLSLMNAWTAWNLP